MICIYIWSAFKGVELKFQIMSKKRDLNRAKTHREKTRSGANIATFKRKYNQMTTLDLPFKDMYFKEDGELYFLFQNNKFWIRDDRIKMKFQKVRRHFIVINKPPFRCQVIRERLDYIDQGKLIKLLEDEYARLCPDEKAYEDLKSGIVNSLPAACECFDDWRNIEFLNGEIIGLYNGERFPFKWKTSEKGFQKAQACLQHVKLPYGFEIENGKVVRLFIEDRVFRFIDIVVNIQLDRQKFEELFQNNNSKTTFSGYQKQLVEYYPYKKQRYFSHLLSICQKDIYRIAEKRAFKSNSSIKTEFSFLFEIKKSGRIFWVWEMVDSHSATYVFTCETGQDSSKICQGLLEFLVSSIENKRQKLTVGRLVNLQGIKEIVRINHNPSQLNYSNWKDKLSSKLG